MKYTIASAAFFAVGTQAQALASALGAHSLVNFTSVVNAFPALVGEFVLAGQDVTIFAPADGAVGIQGLLRSAKGPGRLTDSILRYHVLKGALTASTIRNSGIVETLLTGNTSPITGGQRLQITKNDAGTVILTSGLGATAQVTKPDIRFDGGYIHLIDTVLTPPASIAATAYNEGIQTLIQTLERPGIDLLDTVEDLKDVTIFAPTDGAFDSAESTISGLNEDGIKSALTYHVAKGVGYNTDFLHGQVIPTVNGKLLSVTVTNGTVSINGARIVKTDLLTRNGVIHVIESVLIPPV